MTVLQALSNTTAKTMRQAKGKEQAQDMLTESPTTDLSLKEILV